MGITGVGFSSRLTKTAKVLFKDPIDFLDVFIHQPKPETHGLWIVVIEGAFGSWLPMKGSGMSDSQFNAFIKALVEFSEVYLMRKLNLTDREGISGGLFYSTALVRSQSEVIERDAFLYHYRRKIPFLSLEKIIATHDPTRSIHLYKMASASENLISFLATDNLCAEGKNACLLIGLGCHSSAKIAMNKAVGEYSTMYLDHLLRPGWCEDIAHNITVAKRLPDFHHACSRDPRNIEKFLMLCKGSTEILRNPADSHKWEVEKFNSPIRFIKFVRSRHPDLERLTFGEPELDSGPSEFKLYHPIW